VAELNAAFVLAACHHRPEGIVRVEDVDVFIHQHDLLQFAAGIERHARGFAATLIVLARARGHLQNR
jgi:predicted hydrolase (HD superfamily)